MGTRIKIIALIVGCLFFFFVGRVVKKRSFYPSFSVLWLGVALFLVSIPVFEPIYQWIAYSVIGIIDARHLIYIVLIGFLLVYVFYLSDRLSRMSDQIQCLISEVAILRRRIEEDGTGPQ